MCLSFVGYDGIVERLVVLSLGNENTSVVIEALSYFWYFARWLFLRLPSGKLSYFFVSEKSLAKLLQPLWHFPSHPIHVLNKHKRLTKWLIVSSSSLQIIHWLGPCLFIIPRQIKILSLHKGLIFHLWFPPHSLYLGH